MTISTVASIEQMAQRALSNVATVQASYAIAKAAIEARAPGDFCECGVFAGAQSAAMARAIMENPGCGKRVHLFDSFEGIPQCGPEDLEFLEAGHEAGLSTCTMAAVQGHMAEWGIDPNVLVYHPGWFAETLQWANDHYREVGLLSKNHIERIAILRLDGDLYESTKVCMDHLYPLLSPGGWLIVDDFGLSGARKAVLDYLGGNSGPAYFQKQ